MVAAQISILQTYSPTSTPVYVPRNSASGKIFQIIQRNWKKFEHDMVVSDQPLSQYVRREFEAFLGCGILSKGFIRLVCDTCKTNRFVPFSCKKRGFYPSCCGRRMNEGAAFLVDHVFPQVPVRQWVVSFPMPLRFWMARNPRLATAALSIFQRILRRHYKLCARKLGITGDLQTGSITMVQRFGGALNLNIHFHILSLDGVFQFTDDPEKVPEFIETGRPKNEDLLKLVKKFQIRMLKLLQRRGLVQKVESENDGDVILETPNIETILQNASVINRIALGPNSGQRVRKIGSLGAVTDEPFKTGELSVVLGGYSIHAATYVHKNNRTDLERLCRYILRPPVAEERCEIKGDKVLYHLKSPWKDGTRAIEFTGLQLIEKLVAIIPQPKIHLTRFHGVLAPHSNHRSRIVPNPVPTVASCSHEEKEKPKKPRLKWAQLLKRVFKVDMENCPCGGKLQFVAAIMNSASIQKILEHERLEYYIPDFDPP
jgi:hypothetical protein